MKILYNARIHTLDERQPLASVIVMDHGEVIAIGNDALLQEFDGVQCEKEDLEGRVVLPGLIDAHLHLQAYALLRSKVDCETGTLDECLRRVAERAAHTERGKWILGHGWNQNVWGRWATASDLDQFTADHPVFLTAKSLHSSLVNSATLHLAGIHAGTPDPRDGQIQRDEKGLPTGVLLESATLLVSKFVPEPTLSELVVRLDEAQNALWQLGLTGVHDFDGRECFLALQQLHLEDALRLRVTKGIPVELLEQACELGLRTGFGDDWLRIGSVKVFMDGALGPRTAAMFQPYEGELDNKGILNLDGESLFELSRRAADTGLGMAVHAIGDRANHEVLNAYEQLRQYESKQGLPQLRHRIEHVQLLHLNDVNRLARLDVIASMQPLHTTSDMLMADRYWGERTAFAYALKTQLEQGAHLAFGSDAPVESPNPFWGIHAAVTRQRADGSPGPQGWHPEQRISVQQAIHGFTRGPAYAACAEKRQGWLTKGSLADLIVLEDDPFTCDPSDLRDIRTSATMVGGKWVYRS